MKPNTYTALVKINNTSGMTISSLAEEMEVTNPTANTLVKKLVQEGLITQDKRGPKSNGFSLSITVKGLKILGEEFSE